MVSAALVVTLVIQIFMPSISGREAETAISIREYDWASYSQAMGQSIYQNYCSCVIPFIFILGEMTPISKYYRALATIYLRLLEYRKRGKSSDLPLLVFASKGNTRFPYGGIYTSTSADIIVLSL